MMVKILLKILGLSYSHAQQDSYALILGEVDGKRRLPIVIGAFEAQAIALELEKMKPARPLTHDLFRNFANTFGIEVEEVIINKFSEGIFYSRLVCNDGNRVTEIDSRTSDAVAIALRFDCPIYTFETIMAQAGILYQEETQEDMIEKPVEEEVDSEFASLTLTELEEILREAISNEDYERASMIRDEIKKRM
jgi:uncharacterized protein